jgi:hypothetical protein
VLSCCLIDLPGIGGKFVIEAVEVDALTTGYEPFFIRTAAVEMPEQRALLDLVPLSVRLLAVRDGNLGPGTFLLQHATHFLHFEVCGSQLLL